MVQIPKNKSKQIVSSPVSMLPHPFSIRKVKRETYDTFTIDLAPTSGDGRFDFEPGQFNMLYAYGVGEVPISISGDPTNPDILVHTTRAVGTVTRAIEKLKVGDILGIRGPLGTSWPIEKAIEKDIIIVTGGIGLAPLRPVIYYIVAHRADYGKVTLLYGARTPSDLLYIKELEKWRSRGDMDIHVTVDRGMDNWQGNVGVVTTLIPKARFDESSCVAMACGPEIMIRFTILGLQKRGIDDDRIYVSLERNMKCGIGLCGHCQVGPIFVCKDGPVFSYDRVKDLITKREI